MLTSMTDAEPVRVATYSPELTRDGPGLLLRDILKGEDPQVAAVVSVIVSANPDILLLTGFDFDAGQAALDALADRLEAAGASYPHRFSLRPNTGMATGLDMDGNGRSGEPRDAQGWGRFAGEGGMALLSRYPVETASVRDLSLLLWKDIPGAELPRVGGAPFPSAEAQAIQRLSTTGHWIVRIGWPGREPLTLLAFSATPPVFDGPEDLNGLRNADEIGLWQALLDGALAQEAPASAFVLLGNANLDPADGDGRREAISALLADSRLQDPKPASPGGSAEADRDQSGPPALDTADWPGGAENGPGNLRVDYVLPSADLAVQASGVVWPSAGAALLTARAASRHRLVWVDLVPDR